MFWRIYFHCNQVHAADLGAPLEDHASAVSWFESKDPEVWVVEAITTSKPKVDEFINFISPVCQTLNLEIPSLNVEEIPETDWLEATWRNFPPQQIGRYYVYGSHTSPTPPKDSVTLEINAATAFGSGEHETTTGCLLTLDDLALEGKSFQKPLDMGCGSGILAIAIAKTWNIPVIAVDNDPESVRVTTNNAILNLCDSLLKTCVSEGFENALVREGGPYDLIVANILAGPLIDMAKELSQNLAPKGMVILSGLLNRHREDVVNAYKAQGIRLHSLRTLNDWIALLLIKEQAA
jgi:ribosomal protein L11 methyltransferase